MNTVLILLLIFLVCLVVIIFGVLIFFVKQLTTKQSQSDLELLIHQAFDTVSQKMAEQNRVMLAGEKEVIRVDLDNKQKAMETLVRSLQIDLAARQDELRNLEQDRSKKFSEITTTLEQHRVMTDELKVSTQQLSAVLLNNQARGGWGERIIEDLLVANGLVEGVHYVKQTKLQQSSLRPDISLLLPNQRVVPVDVKFPYAEMQKMAIAESKAAKDQHLKQFATDLKNKIDKVAEYISPEGQTMDYAILFVPNEMIFSFINQQFPDLIDEAMTKKVILVSPFTFVIVARTVIESYRNFMIEDKLKDILQQVQEFVGEWGRFQEEFLKFGRSIETLKTGYETISTTRMNQMGKKVAKIEGYHRGSLLTSGKKAKSAEAEIIES